MNIILLKIAVVFLFICFFLGIYWWEYPKRNFPEWVEAVFLGGLSGLFTGVVTLLALYGAACGVAILFM